MTKDVLVFISGLHQEAGADPAEEDERIEVIVPGVYYYKNDKHYILYEEIEENGSVTKNQLKIYGDDHVELHKSGLLTVKMVFETGQRHPTVYQTPFGQIPIVMNTRAVELEEKEECISIGIDYCLEVDREPFADCRIEIKITRGREHTTKKQRFQA